MSAKPNNNVIFSIRLQINSINFLKFNTSEALHYLSLFNNGFYYLRHILNSILTLKCDLLTFSYCLLQGCQTGHREEEYCIL